MELGRVLRCLGVNHADPAAVELYRVLTRVDGKPVPPDWRALSAGLVRRLEGLVEHEPLVLGVAGGQGSGKTTLAGALRRGFEAAGVRAVTCSLDDFYLSRARRRDLAGSVHPLLATRGVPGTHDVDLLERVMAGLGEPGVVDLPVFDKGADDRLPRSHWRRVPAPVDVLVLEGWCVGARPEAEPTLEVPVNELEAAEDADGTWRRYVNAALAGPYARLWDRLHVLVYLQVPGLDAVIRWRTEQEQALPPDRRMSRGNVARFVAHYERVTAAMQADLPQRADLVARLNDEHRMVTVRCNRR